MVSSLNILICAGAAVIIYFILGLPLAMRLAPRPLAVTLALAFGWAAHSVVALPLFFAIGLSRPSVIAVIAVPIVAAIAVLWRDRGRPNDEQALARSSVIVLAAALASAVLLALAVMAAVVPKVSSEGVSLAGAIFDHSKVAMINEMSREGAPPVNPFFGATGSPARLAYYYLWHFSAAELSLLLNISGWEADAGLTWFTAFASLAMMIGFAAWLGGGASAALWVVALATTASMRPLLYWLFGVDRAENFVGNQSGFGGWLFQTSWAPQHTTSAICAVLSIFLLVQIIQGRSLFWLLLLTLTVAAGFESSTWVGGIVFPLAAVPTATVSLARIEPHRRIRIIAGIAVATLLALLLASPFLYDQWQMTALRAEGPPVAIVPYEVLGDVATDAVGEIANWLVYWFIFLVVEFPAFYLTGLVALFYLLKDRALPRNRKSVVVAFALLLGASLGAAWLLESTLGENNDLGWRAVLPAVMMLIIAAAAGLSRLVQKPRPAVMVAAIALILLGIPGGIRLIYDNATAHPNISSKDFAATAALWQAVRRYTPVDERVANNPLFMEYMTPWSVNISWALLADRRSCFANATLVRPFSALSKAQVDLVDSQFARVFDGHAKPGDIEDLATQYHCRTAVVTPTDVAWNNDPFASSSHYRLVEGNSGWRIYRVVNTARQ